MRRVSAWASGLVSLIGAARSLVVFSVAVVPRLRAQLRVWELVARAIPDPRLRAQALDCPHRKASNAEAAAVFSLLAPRRCRSGVVALLVALQVLTDFLDTFSDPLRNGLMPHCALADAVRGRAEGTDYYRHHGERDDGGYIRQVVESARTASRRSPQPTRSGYRSSGPHAAAARDRARPVTRSIGDRYASRHGRPRCRASRAISGGRWPRARARRSPCTRSSRSRPTHGRPVPRPSRSMRRTASALAR